jgi:hypothetical protein
VIASSAFFVLDAILDWPVSLYDGSWSQWGQMAAGPGGMLNPDSPWRTDVPSRSELFVYNYDTTPGPVFYTSATGTILNLNDMTSSGTFTGTANRTFTITIDGEGTPNTFTLVSSSTTTSVPITPGDIAVGEGMFVSFASTTGHTLGDRWDFITRRPVEALALDGSICSSRLNLDGTTTFSSACTPLLPNSYSGTANQIEEEDSVYFGAGGGSGGGGGGGGPIAPGY